MLPDRFLESLRLRVAEIAIGPSSLRNQGASLVIASARSFLKCLDLRSFVASKPTAFMARLDQETAALRQSLPAGAQHWGAARKAINLFLRDAVYCSDLATSFGLHKIRDWLEVPLDRSVAKGLRDYPGMGQRLQPWRTIKSLSPEVSSAYQHVASAVAQEEGVARVDLDIIFFRADLLRSPDVAPMSNA
jgi:hypothetical protein